jgi:hypothetical protein
MPLSINHSVCIRSIPDYWITVEDFHLDAGGEGATITMWEPGTKFGEEYRRNHICLTIDEAQALLGALESLLNPETLLKP